MVILVILLASFWSSVEGSELVGNYKFWNSVSDSIIYDHSGLRNHLEYSSNNFYLTDRGIMIYDGIRLTFPSNRFKFYPVYRDFMVSYWHIRKDSKFSISRVFSVLYTNNTEIRIFFEVSTGGTKIQAQMFDQIRPGWLIDSNYSTPDLVNKWRLYSFRVSQNLSNTESTITIYIDLDYITFFTVTRVSLDSQSNIAISGGNSPLYGIVYEIWWHKDVSDITELDYLLISSSSCECSYGCVTSPTIKCLPSYDSTYNYRGDNCSPGCLNSCNEDFECIANSKAECKYGLYDLESGNCLFYCPDNSCIFSTSLELTCKIGYKQVSDNPPACIPLQCISYERKHYKYICYECEVGYIPDYFGEFCICDTGFTAISLDYLICVKIDKCLAYHKVDDKYVCSSCIEGYSIDSEGNCNQCESNYIKVLDEPFTCITRIENCNQYRLKDGKWECELCEVGYISISTEICIEDADLGLEVCESNSFLSDGSCVVCPETCESCIISKDKIRCTECKPSYIAIKIDDEVVCILCSEDDTICEQETNIASDSDSENNENDSSSQNNERDNSDQKKHESSSLSESIIVSQSHIIFQVLALVSLVVSVISRNPNSFFAMLGTSQILYFILLYNLDIPDRVRTVIEGVNIMQICPNIFEYFIPNNKTLYELDIIELDIHLNIS